MALASCCLGLPCIGLSPVETLSSKSIGLREPAQLAGGRNVANSLLTEPVYSEGNNLLKASLREPLQPRHRNVAKVSSLESFQHGGRNRANSLLTEPLYSEGNNLLKASLRQPLQPRRRNVAKTSSLETFQHGGRNLANSLLTEPLHSEGNNLLKVSLREPLNQPRRRNVAKASSLETLQHGGRNVANSLLTKPLYSAGNNLLKASLRQPLQPGRRNVTKASLRETFQHRRRDVAKALVRMSLQAVGSNLSRKAFLGEPLQGINAANSFFSSSRKCISLARKCNGTLETETPRTNIADINESKSDLASGSSNLSSLQHVLNEVLGQAAKYGGSVKCKNAGSIYFPVASEELLNEAYKRCGEICAEYAKTFYLGTMLMTPERKKAIWAIYVWCRRTDELVDGPNASQITAIALDRWEERLENIFKGKPYDMFDAALADTVSKFSVDIQAFRDMIQGMRMDLVKPRYETFNELYLYCYYVAGTVGLMSVPVMGIDPQSKATTESVYKAAVALGIANQLTNILRDVGEDARRGRIYLPRDELKEFGLSEEDIFARKVTEKWRAFMAHQIKRAHLFFDEAEKGVLELDKDSRLPVWASLILYRQILDAIEKNDYNNFSERAYVGRWKKMRLLPAAYARSLLPPSSLPEECWISPASLI